jgi:peptide/nickel transport system ATP-binding protein
MLKVEGLDVHFPMPTPADPGRVLRAVDEISFEIKAGSTFGIVGESGSGKSTTAMSIMRLGPITHGRLVFQGEDISAVEGKALRKIRRHLQIIFQDPYSSLDPRRSAGAIIREPLDRLQIGTKAQREARVYELLQMVGLRPDQAALFPHQFSGGQRQRINIARSLATEPALVVCDEPVSALDVAIQAQVINLLKRLQKQLGLTYLFISHDLGIVQYMCDEIAVLFLGRIVEQASRRELFENAQHPYTRALLAAVPSLENIGRKGKAPRIIEDPPSPLDPPSGCSFHPRCAFAKSRCKTERPDLRDFRGGHQVACHYAGTLFATS